MGSPQSWLPKRRAIQQVFEEFEKALSKTQYIVGQNISFDINIMGAEFYRYGVATAWENCLFWTPVPKSQPNSAE